MPQLLPEKIRLRVFLFNILFFSTTFFVAAIALLASIGPGSGRIRWCLRQQCRFINWLARVVLGARIEVRGLEQFKDGERPALIVSKHQSELDVFTPLAIYPDLSAVAMAELARYPLIGPVLRKLDYILVSVEGKRVNQLDQVMEGARKAHAQGRPILIYPEGELMRIGSRQRYRSGVWHIYNDLGVPATPVALSCGLVWPQRKWIKRVNQTCVIEFLPPIAPGLDKGAFMERLEATIESNTMRLIREHGAPEDVAIAEERHRLGLNNDDPKAQPVDAAKGAAGST
ncbi:MAG: 1-acyl-sn-glycerol-3-phosphate acyltransferase [Neomegalonema sp.]|nr:1-acyl-sn-glycerol-3-phosphate acyltransferase [Neomegalonema sp.]